jgi:hypothetical protein
LFEDIHCCTQQGEVSHETLRVACEPLFEKLIVALQQAVQQRPADAVWATKATYSTTFLRLDEESTEADDSPAFASIFSVTSEGEDGIESVSDSIPTSICRRTSTVSEDPEKCVMVCRHWKTKGWCRLESNCKFLHPEHKRGVAAPTSGNKDNEGEASMGRKKRSSQKKSNKPQAVTGGNGQNNNAAMQSCCYPTTSFAYAPPAPGFWVGAEARCA